MQLRCTVDIELNITTIKPSGRVPERLGAHYVIDEKADFATNSALVLIRFHQAQGFLYKAVLAHQQTA
jgi:hypothetical protein